MDHTTFSYGFYNHIKKYFSAYSFNDNIGLVNGHSAWILYFYNLYKVFNTEEDELLVADLLTRSIEFLNSTHSKLPITYGNGLTGFALTLDYLLEEAYLSKDDCSEVMEQLSNRIALEAKRQSLVGNFDLFDGSLGMIQYLVEQPCENTDWLKVFIGALHDNIKDSRFGRVWTTTKTVAGEPLEYINLGLPHGLLGILTILARIKEKGLYNVDDLIATSIDTLRQVSKIKFSPDYHYPCFISTNSDKYIQSSLAWCYGDLITGYIMMKIAKVTGDNWLAESAHTLLHGCLHRTNSFTGDISLCHGSMSVSLLFKKIFENTGIVAFQHASYIWKSKTIETMNQYETTGLPNTTSKIYQSSSLLYGLPGVYLSLLTVQTDKASGWERLLLL